jgi:hypothetical protein
VESLSSGGSMVPLFFFSDGVGRLALTVVDEFRDGDGRLRLSLLGIPLWTQTGHELAVGEAMRYLAELVWVPQAIAANRELKWRQVDDTAVEVTAAVGATSAAVRREFNSSGAALADQRSHAIRPLLLTVGRRSAHRRT